MAFSAGGCRNHLVCVSILPLEAKKPTTYAIEWGDERKDKRLLTEVLKVLDEYSVLIGHYICGFDIPYLNSRAAYHGLYWDHKRKFVYDTYAAARRCNLKAERKALDFLIDFFRIEQEKTKIYPVEWSGVDSPYQATFDKTLIHIIKHCEADVLMTRKVFNALWVYDRSMPNLPVYKK